MASEIMNAILETERQCAEKKARAREEAAAIIAAAEKKAASMRAQAEDFAKRKYDDILTEAEKSASAQAEEKARETGERLSRIKSDARSRKPEAVKKTVELLLRLS